MVNDLLKDIESGPMEKFGKEAGAKEARATQWLNDVQKGNIWLTYEDCLQALVNGFDSHSMNYIATYTFFPVLKY
jgi:hypothetical protein